MHFNWLPSTTLLAINASVGLIPSSPDGLEEGMEGGLPATGIFVYRGYLPLFFGIGLLILFTLGWAVLKIKKRKPDGGAFEGPLLYYIAVFLTGLVVGSVLFMVKPDFFLTIFSQSILARWF